MTDFLRQLEEDRKQLERVERIRESVIELDIERPGLRQIEAFLFNLEDSQTPQEQRDFILLNLESFSLNEFWSWWAFVEEHRLSNDPRKQFVRHVKNMTWKGLKNTCISL